MYIWHICFIIAIGKRIIVYGHAFINMHEHLMLEYMFSLWFDNCIDISKEIERENKSYGLFRE